MPRIFLLRTRQPKTLAAMEPTAIVGRTNGLPFAKKSPGVLYAQKAQINVAAENPAMAANAPVTTISFFERAIFFAPNVRGLPCRTPDTAWKKETLPALAVVSC
ncbi:MAG: hypothetical protein IPL39_08390 [Opitutaceae bacterium]|nr:hypothetical protein [Opitutaceae bacterium]